MRHRHTCFFLSILFLTQFAALQSNAQLLPNLTIPFEVNGQQLKNPLVGGFNDPQFSAVDLNDDGILDLFVYDRIGDVASTYINNGASNQVDYTYAPEYLINFPDVTDWALLRDYDNDGIMDLFASAPPGIPGVNVYRGYFEDGKIAFNPVPFYGIGSNVLSFEDGGDLTNIYVSSQDVPAIDDVDGDGDLDILSFGVNGGYIYYHVNQSVERGYGADSLQFKLESTCLGGIYESGLSGCICLPEEPGSCCSGFNSNTADTRHAGSTLVTFDNDGDGDKELILGDISFTNMVMLINTQNDEDIHYGDQDCQFPNYDLTVDLDIFPAGYYVDVNNDGKRDFLAAPNAPSNTQDYFCAWYYRNDGTDNNPTFNFQKKDLFIEDMVDLGTGANPTFVDYNQDGLLDLVVGNLSRYQAAAELNPRLYLFENIGTAENPAFKLISDDYLNFSQYGSNFFYLAPTFGDLDNDGDFDLLVGGQLGTMFFVENIAGPGNPFSFGIPQPNYFDIDVGQNSTPQIVDMNRDGLPDLVIGEVNGNLNYFENIGTPSNPQFESDQNESPNNPFFGQVDTSPPGNPNGHSDPFIIDFNGKYTLFTGSSNGRLLRYDDIDDNLDGAFTLTTEQYGDNVKVGHEIKPVFADINNDNVLELFIGNRRGGLNAFVSNLTTSGSVSTQYLSPQSEFRIFPNPVEDRLTIELIQDRTADLQINVYNAIGQLVLQQQENGRQVTLNTSHLSAGLYICELGVGENISVQKFIVR